MEEICGTFRKHTISRFVGVPIADPPAIGCLMVLGPDLVTRPENDCWRSVLPVPALTYFTTESTWSPAPALR